MGMEQKRQIITGPSQDSSMKEAEKLLLSARDIVGNDPPSCEEIEKMVNNMFQLLREKKLSMERFGPIICDAIVMLPSFLKKHRSVEEEHQRRIQMALYNSMCRGNNLECTVIPFLLEASKDASVSAETPRNAAHESWWKVVDACICEDYIFSSKTGSLSEDCKMIVIHASVTCLQSIARCLQSLMKQQGSRSLNTTEMTCNQPQQQQQQHLITILVHLINILDILLVDSKYAKTSFEGSELVDACLDILCLLWKSLSSTLVKDLLKLLVHCGRRQWISRNHWDNKLALLCAFLQQRFLPSNDVKTTNIPEETKGLLLQLIKLVVGDPTLVLWFRTIYGIDHEDDIIIHLDSYCGHDGHTEREYSSCSYEE